MGILIIGEDVSVTEELYKNNESINKLNSELLAMNDMLINKSIKDSLTNLYNHQHINEVLEIELKHAAQESTKQLCVMMLDVDYFKQVNDRYGHQIGDRVLIAISDLISGNVRKEDYIGRYGGEEFLVVLPDINLEAAVSIAENIRLSVQAFDYGLSDLKTTISIGVVMYEGETSNAIINKADMLLYRAKYNGRNRVEY
jgi:diguanylate cyclase (GGDEF)-like protein